MSTFTQDWFTRNIAVWEGVLAPLKDKENVQCLEVGVFEGRATIWLLENIITGQGAKIDVVDTFEGSMEHEAHKVDTTKLLNRFMANTEDYKKKIRISVGKSQELLRESRKLDYYDLIYIDGSHKASDVLQDIVLAWPLLKKGGTFILDDYDWEFYEDYRLVPKVAIDIFLDLYHGEFELLEKNMQVIVKKI